MTTIFLSFFGISASISLMVVALIFLTPFLNTRYAAKWKYLIWIFLALRLLIPFSGTSGPFVMNLLSQMKTQTTPRLEDKNTNTAADIAIPSNQIIVEIPTQMTTPITVHSGKNDLGITMLDVVAFVWMMGSLIFISIHFISYFYYKRQVIKRGEIVEDTHILHQMLKLKHELGIRHTIQAIEYHELESPMIIGFFKPILVLPKEQYNSEELFFILKHELVHLKRKDTYFKLLFVIANAIHWYNPFIWIMQKEATIDMELSCDERVTQDTSYTVRKAYTETLLSMLHKQCAKKTLLSTQFYGGTKIMKKRFKNILVKNRKKNGIPIFICIVILTISFGALVGCFIAKEDTETIDVSNLSEPSEKETNQMQPMSIDNSSADNNILENTTTLTFSKEGEQEQKRATLAIGDGYSIYLPDGEWQQSDTDIWTATVNEQIQLWVTHFEAKSLDTIEQELANSGYIIEPDYDRWKQEGDILYYVRLKKFGNDIWGVFYCYPIEAEEGFGRELPVIADTFVLLIGEDNEKSSPSEEVSEYLGAEDCQEIKNIMDEFATAYFDGNADIIQKFLADTYEGEIETFENTGTISDITIKGLSDADEKKLKDGRYVVSLEFRDSNYEDMFMYLTVVFVKQEGSWNIQFYGIEG